MQTSYYNYQNAVSLLSIFVFRLSISNFQNFKVDLKCIYIRGRHAIGIYKKNLNGELSFVGK